MARNINDRLSQLNTRRKGTDRINRVGTTYVTDVLAKSLIQESYQKRATTQPHTRYALGAMQEVSVDYTRIGLDTAERVGKQLVALSMAVDFRLQGSVPLNVHVRGVSDVDLLTLTTGYRTYDRHGARALAGLYTSPDHRGSVVVLTALRSEAERLLKSAYPAATVDCSKGKCIALSGGSLARPVDVVPSHWHDTADYQASYQEHDRGVKVLDKKVPEAVENMPFRHIKRVHDLDMALLGGLKKAIRLTKNVKNDAEHADRASKLPSFDIASLLYHADKNALTSGYTYELAILRETQRFLDWCYNNQAQSTQFRTPDGSRTILNSAEKISALLAISVEMDTLAKEVAKEQVATLRYIDPNWLQIDEALRNARIPLAA